MAEDRHASQGPGRSEGATDPAPGGEKPSDIQRAMEDALHAVEARERDHDAPTPEKTDAAAAVTEALLEARRELASVLEQTRKEAADLRDKWLRAAADLENYKRRAQREKQDTERFGNERLLKDLLPVVDDLDRALKMLEERPTEASSLAVEGMELVRRKFLTQLERNGVSVFSAKGEPFDPNRHEAVQQVPSDRPAGAVVDEMQRGFLLHDRLLRPALVIVSMGPPPPSPEGASSAGGSEARNE